MSSSNSKGIFVSIFVIWCVDWSYVNLWIVIISIGGKFRSSRRFEFIGELLPHWSHLNSRHSGSSSIRSISYSSPKPTYKFTSSWFIWDLVLLKCKSSPKNSSVGLWLTAFCGGHDAHFSTFLCVPLKSLVIRNWAFFGSRVCRSSRNWWANSLTSCWSHVSL